MHTGRRAERKQSSTLIDDCEAFLAGRLAERMFRATGLVPDWAWTNLLAHGTYEDLRKERDKPSHIGRAALSESWQRFNYLERWRRARSYLAAEVLEMVGSQRQLDQLQQRSLLPLEEALGVRQGVGLFDPRDWVNLVLATLEDHRRSEERFRRSQ
jgi:hypothetical protein